MSGFDINDVHRKGLAGLLDAADGTDPVLGRDIGKLVRTGVALLEQLRDEAFVAQDGAAASNLVAAVQTDDAKRRAVVLAYKHRHGVVTGILTQIRQGPRGVGMAVTAFEKAIRAEAKTVQQELENREGEYRATVLDRLLEPLGITGLKCPGGWSVTAEGVTSPAGEVVARAPIVVVGSSRDVDSGAVRLELAWRAPGEDGHWTRRHVPRSQVMNHKKLIELADEHAPVSSVTASSLVTFLDLMESENAFEPHASAAHMGWVTAGTFLHGAHAIGEPVVLTPDDATLQTARGYRQAGTFEGWCAVVERDIVDRPMVLAGIYVACASVLLHVLGRPGFVFEWAGLSSRGKTTTMKVAASCFGVPDDKDDGLVRKWNSAGITGFLHSAWFLQNLPLLLDETKEADPSVLRQIMYTHGSGQDRMRGKPDGNVRAMRTWRSILLSTGEAPIVSFSQDQGARARCIVLNGPPLGEESSENRSAANRICAGLMQHHGHMGPNLVAWLLGNPDQWLRLREEYTDIAEALAAEGGTAISKRLFEHVAVIQVTANLLHRLGLPGDSEEAIRLLIGTVQDAEPDSDMPQLAADALFAWASANEEKFWRRDPRVREPNGGWLGRWDYGDEWTVIGFQPEPMAKFLASQKYDVPSILNAWVQRDMRVIEKKGNPRYGKNQSRLVVMNRSAFSGA